MYDISNNIDKNYGVFDSIIIVREKSTWLFGLQQSQIEISTFMSRIYFYIDSARKGTSTYRFMLATDSARKGTTI